MIRHPEPLLLLPNGDQYFGEGVVKAKPSYAEVLIKGHRAGDQSYARTDAFSLGGLGVNGAAIKQGDWSVYYRMYRQHAYVYAAINKIAKVATNSGFDFIPRDSHDQLNDTERIKLKRFFDNIRDPISTFRRFIRHLLIYGDAYIHVIYNRRREPIDLKVLPPASIQIKADLRGNVLKYYQTDPNLRSRKVQEFEPHEILHGKIDDPDNDLYGLSPLEAVMNAVSTDLFAQAYNENFFKNNAATGTIISLENPSNADVERFKEFIQSGYSGTENAHKPLVITSKATVHKGVTTHNEMGFLQGREFLIQEILAVLDVPPAKLGLMEDANRSNSKEQDKTFRSENIAPLQYIIESVLNEQLVKPILKIKKTLIKFHDADVRDAQDQMDLWTDAVQNGLMSFNEVRAKMGLAPIEGGNMVCVIGPTGWVPVVDLELYARLAKPNSDQILPEWHEGHGHPRGDDGSLSGPIDSTDDSPAGAGTPATPSSSKAVSKHQATQIAIAMQGTLTWIETALKDDRSLRSAYAYAVDAAETTAHPLLAQTVEALEKALGTPKPLLRQAYVERAETILHSLVPTEGEEDDDRIAA